MADVFSKAKRSEIMSLIRAKNTQAERTVFSHLRSKRVYFQKHYRGVVGCPDIALPKKKRAVFIDGDFWHGKRFKETRHKLTSFWRNKISTNIERDIRNKRKLRKLGWKIMRVWESNLKKNPEKTLAKIADFLSADAMPVKKISKLRR